MATRLCFLGISQPFSIVAQLFVNKSYDQSVIIDNIVDRCISICTSRYTGYIYMYLTSLAYKKVILSRRAYRWCATPWLGIQWWWFPQWRSRRPWSPADSAGHGGSWHHLLLCGKLGFQKLVIFGGGGKCVKHTSSNKAVSNMINHSFCLPLFFPQCSGKVKHSQVSTFLKCVYALQALRLLSTVCSTTCF